MMRVASLFDIGCFREPFVDNERARMSREEILRDLKCKPEDVCFLSTGLRPLTPDEFFIAGPLKSHPNVFLNTGFGMWGLFTLCSAKIIES